MTARQETVEIGAEVAGRVRRRNAQPVEAERAGALFLGAAERFAAAGQKSRSA